MIPVDLRSGHQVGEGLDDRLGLFVRHRRPLHELSGVGLGDTGRLDDRELDIAHRAEDDDRSELLFPLGGRGRFAAEGLRIDAGEGADDLRSS